MTLSMILVCFFFNFWGYGMFYAAHKMVQMHAYVFATSNSVIYILLMYATCVKPVCIEAIGVLIALSGMYCLILDNDAERMDGVKPEFIDYVITMACATSGAFYFYFNHKIVKEIPMLLLFLITSVYGFLIAIITAKFMSEEVVIFSLDEKWGCFGFLNSNWVLYCVFVWGCLSTIPGGTGYVVAMLFFPP